MVVQIRFLFRNVLKVLAMCIRAVTTWFEAPYRQRLYKSSENRTILFIIIMKNHFEIFKRIYNELNGDKRLRICFTDPLSIGKKWLSFLAQQGIDSSQILGWHQVLLRRWDACIDPDYYPPLVLRSTRWIQTSHGAAGRARGPSCEDYTISKKLRRYDKFFCYSENQRHQAVVSGQLKNADSAILVGYPKLDGLVDGSVSRDEVLRDYGAEPSRLSVLYAPSWCTHLSLEQIGDELIDALTGGPWTFMVKLHPRSYQIKSRSIGKDMEHKHNWKDFLDQRAGKGRLMHLSDQDTCHYLTAADILITDHGSTLFEYMVLGRPVLYYDSDEASRFMSIGGRLEKIRNAAYSFQTPKQALQLLKSLSSGQLTDSREKLAAKKQLVDEVFYDVGGATKRAVTAIYDVLKIAPPAGRSGTFL